jgi:hypothetical protein
MKLAQFVLQQPKSLLGLEETTVHSKKKTNPKQDLSVI